jgi:hypothetical protein
MIKAEANKREQQGGEGGTVAEAELCCTGKLSLQTGRKGISKGQMLDPTLGR